MSAVSDLSDDFPDRLSPMMVKELRQGLRAKAFVAVFLVLQGLLGLILLAASAGASSDRAGMAVSQVIFVFFSLAVLVIQPLRGVAALSSEIKGNTIDLMVLTRLSSLRIVAGKWIALVGQSALLVATIVPYLILRYYFGGMNLFAELLLVLLVFLFSAALTAVTVGLSASSSILVRGLIPLAGTVALTISIFGVGFGGGLNELIEICSLESSQYMARVTVFVFTIAYLGWHALSLGASLIAPQAENHATIRRIVALISIAVTGGIFVWNHALFSELIFMYVALGAPAIVLALSEPNQLVPTVCRPFVKRGFIGRIAGRFLYPGWPAGVFFTGLLASLCGTVALILPDFQSSHSSPEIIVSLALLGGLLFPAVLTVFFGKKVKERFACFLLLLIASGVFTVVLGALGGSLSEQEFLWFFVWNPLVLAIMREWYGFPREALVAAGTIVDAAYFFLLLIKAFQAFRSIRETERAILE
ncbi:MAG TPA: hypothetical protein VIM57_00450 [Luteolibacter sp.]